MCRKLRKHSPSSVEVIEKRPKEKYTVLGPLFFGEDYKIYTAVCMRDLSLYRRLVYARLIPIPAFGDLCLRWLAKMQNAAFAEDG